MRLEDDSVRIDNDQTEERLSMKRRQFLQVGLMGMAASAVGTASAEATAAADSGCQACDPPGPSPPPPPSIRTMAIDGRKFRFDDPVRPRVLVDSAEEWALYKSRPDLVGRDRRLREPGGPVQRPLHRLSVHPAPGQGAEYPGFKVSPPAWLPKDGD